MENNKNTVHIYYNSSLDGRISAAYYFQYIKRTDPKYNRTMLYEVDPDEELDITKIIEGDMIVFLDYPFSTIYNWNIFIGIINLKKNHVVWFDHHMSSIRLLTYFNDRVNNIDSSYIYNSLKNGGDVFYYRENNLDIYYTNNYSTTYGIWCYCNSKLNSTFVEDSSFLNPSAYDIPLLVKYVDHYACNKRSLKNTIEFNYGIYSISKNPKKLHKKLDYPNNLDLFDSDNNNILALETDIIKRCIDDGKIIKKYLHAKNKESIKSSAIKFNIKIGNNNYNCIAINTKSNSLIFEDLINEYDIVCTFHMANYNIEAWEYSLYSNKEFTFGEYSCVDIANMMRNLKFHISSGGNSNAAGFVLSKLIIYPNCTIKIYKTIFGKIKLKVLK